MHVPLPHVPGKYPSFAVSLLGFACLFCLFFLHSVVSAQSQNTNCSSINGVDKCVVQPGNARDGANLQVTISGQVNETGLELKGWSAPGSFLVVSDETSIIGTGTAQTDGSFDFFIHALQANSVHTISVQADNGQQRTPATAFVVTVSGSTTTTVSNILLPSFIDVNPLQSAVGDPITVSGSTVPGGLVTVFIESPLQSTQVTAAADGTWSTELIADFGSLPKGTYQAYAQVSYNSIQSNMSKRIQFEVKEAVTQSTNLTINGYGPPGAFLTFTADGDVVGTGSVLLDGTFSKTIGFIDQDQDVEVKIIADNGEQVTPATTVTAHLTSTQTTTVNDVLLTTFIGVNPDTAPVGSPITVSGVAANDSSIVLTIESPTQSTTVNVDSSGNWSQELLAAFGTLQNGVYRAHGHVVKPGGLVSVESRDVVFDVKQIETATDLIVSGLAAPSAFVTFTENNAVVGTTVANPDGTFSQTLKFPDVDLTRTVSVTADNGTQVTPATVFTATLTAFSTTTVANLVLPTFIDIDPLKVPYGTTVQALGTTVPGATVRLFVQSTLIH